MSETAIVGVGYTDVGEHWHISLRELAREAGMAALADCNVQIPDAIFVGNAYGSTISGQSQLGALIADAMGFPGVEAITVEAADASGGAAIRAAHLAVLSGQITTALVIGVEKVTDAVGSERVRARSIGLDSELETFHGSTLVAQSALLMRRYMHEYGIPLSAFEAFSINAHANGKSAPHAMYHNSLRVGAFSKAPMIADPVNLFDSAPDADGAAALVITRRELADDLASDPIRIIGSSASTDRIALQGRDDMLTFDAVKRSFDLALAQSGLTRDDLDFFELHDAFTIFTALTLESAGFLPRGKGWDVGNTIALDGKLPISTFGGLKSRGNAAGATGVYQAVEAVLQLKGRAGANQVIDASVGVIQNIGGVGSSVFTHILSK